MKMCQVVTTNSHFPLVLVAVITPIFPMNHGPLFLHSSPIFYWLLLYTRELFFAPGCLMVMTKVGLLEDCILLLDALESWTPKSSLDFAAARSKIALLTSSLTCRIEAGIKVFWLHFLKWSLVMFPKQPISKPLIFFSKRLNLRLDDYCFCCCS